MIKVGVADYGMGVWYGGLFDYIERMIDLKKIGYDGMERLQAITEADAVVKSAQVHALGMGYATVNAPDTEHAVQWAAAFGCKYVWCNVSGRDFETYCRQVNYQCEAAKKWGVEITLHNHLGSLVETQEQLLKFIENCPDCKLVLDTAHLAVAEGGDPVYIVEHYFDRIAAVHVKDWVSTDKNASGWYNQGYFTGLGCGNYPVDNIGVVKLLLEKGYDGWLFVEHDTHKREPLLDLKDSREFLRKLGV